MIYRIDGVKYNLERMPDEELQKIADRLAHKVKYLMQDITVVESVILDRQLLRLPFEERDE
jgi:hypothetical protein